MRTQREPQDVGAPSLFPALFAAAWPWAFVAGVASFLLYFLTAASSITWKNDGSDSGELAAAVVTLGVPHPPGYPAYVVVGRLATLLIPLGDAAHRLALLSALAGAAAVGMVVLLAARVGPSNSPRRWIGLLLGGLALGAAPLLWAQATIAEVYALAAVVFAAGLLLLHLWMERRNSKLLAALGLLLGLGAGIHPTVLFVALAAAPLLLVRASPREGLAGLAGLVCGLGIFLLLPVFAARHPPIAWGGPVDLEGFLWTVTGAPYRQLVFGLPLSDTPQRLLSAASLLARQFGPFGWLLAVWGGWLLWREERRFMIAVGLLAGLSLVYALVYNSRDSFLYLLPVVLASSVLLVRGAGDALQNAAAWRPWAPTLLAAALLVAIPGFSIVSNVAKLDLSDDREALDYAVAASTEAGPEGLVLADTDQHVFSLWYHAYVIAPEESPTVIARVLLQFEWYRDQVRRRHPSLLPSEPVAYDQAVQSVLDQAVNRAVYVTFPDPLAAARYDLRPAGPLYRLHPQTTVSSPHA